MATSRRFVRHELPRRRAKVYRSIAPQNERAAMRAVEIEGAEHVPCRDDAASRVDAQIKRHWRLGRIVAPQREQANVARLAHAGNNKQASPYE